MKFKFFQWDGLLQDLAERSQKSGFPVSFYFSKKRQGSFLLISSLICLSSAPLQYGWYVDVTAICGGVTGDSL